MGSSSIGSRRAAKVEIAGAGHREDRKGQRHRDRKARGKGIGTRRCEGADGLTHRERAVDLRSLGPVNWSPALCDSGTGDSCPLGLLVYRHVCVSE